MALAQSRTPTTGKFSVGQDESDRMAQVVISTT
jgi:hypothetical protein